MDMTETEKRRALWLLELIKRPGIYAPGPKDLPAAATDEQGRANEAYAALRKLIEEA